MANKKRFDVVKLTLEQSRAVRWVVHQKITKIETDGLSPETAEEYVLLKGVLDALYSGIEDKFKD